MMCDKQYENAKEKYMMCNKPEKKSKENGPSTKKSQEDQHRQN